MGFSEDQLKALKESFETFDKDKDGNSLGYISGKGFRDFVRSVGNNPSEKTCDEWIKKIGKSDKISFDACLPALEEMSQDKVALADLLEAFKMFDKDGGGYISLNELKHIYSNLGEKFSEEEVNEMAEGIDDGTGMVDYQNFAKMMLA